MIADGGRLHRELRLLAGQALAGSPTDSAPRLYVETLNEMIDMQTVRVSALNNRVPSAVLLFEFVGAAVGLGLLALYLAILSRGVVTVILAAGVRLDASPDHVRPRPPDPWSRAPCRRRRSSRLRASMELPPAAGGAGATPSPLPP